MQGSSALSGADASNWDESAHSAARLIAGKSRPPDGGKLLRAGVEIRLASGWKTYWRYPGDSGVPPRMNFARSENVKNVLVAWPAPERFTEAGFQSIGYKHDVVFPLRVTPIDPGKPAVLRLDLDYAVCEKLCVPVQAKAELTLAGKDAVTGARVAAAEARVPAPARIGEGAALAVRSVTRERGSPARVIVDVAAPADGSEVDLFAEGPTTDWALPLPQPVAGAPAGLHRFSFALDGLPPGAKAEGALLTLTAVAGRAAIEVTYRLD
jgi:DsbC/DsbD-like thiol-disulfide interchange protein